MQSQSIEPNIDGTTIAESPKPPIPVWVLTLGILAAVALILWGASDFNRDGSRTIRGILSVVVAVAVFVPLAALLMRASDRKAAADAAFIPDTMDALTARYGEGDYYITPGFHRVIGIGWKEGLFVIGDKPNVAEAIPFANVESATVEVDGTTVTNTTSATRTNRGSQLGGAVAGGLLLGPAGLLVGGLSGSSRTKGRSTETRFIKSVTLTVRVKDRANPLRRIDFMSAFSGKPTSPGVVEATQKVAHYHALLSQIIADNEAATDRSRGDDGDVGAQIDRLWSLHEKGALTREEYDAQKAKLLPTGGAISLLLAMLVFLGMVTYPSRASAYDLGRLLRGSPELELTTTKSLDAVEQCIILSDLPGMPIVYRYPNKPGSLIHGGREAVPLFAFELIPAADHLDVKVWQGKGQRPKLESCL